MWYYEQHNSQQGPVDEPAITRLIASGQLGPENLVWREGMLDWQPLAATDLGRLLPPRPSAAVSPLAPPQPGAGAFNPYSPPQAEPFVPVREPLAPITWKKVLFSFEGRIPRRHYWAGLLFWIAVFIGVTVCATLMLELAGKEDFIFIPLIPLVILYVWSAIAIQVKRWHDRNKSGAMVLINLIPYVGSIWTFVECGCMRGTDGHNAYGPDPT